MPIYYKIDGYTAEVLPKNKKHFTYDELRLFVGSRIETVPLPGGKVIVVHEEGKLIGLPINRNATEEWKKAYPIKDYPHNNDELIAGDALITENKYLK